MTSFTVDPTSTDHPVLVAVAALDQPANAVLLCAHHHHRTHDPAYDATRLPNGDVRFSRRT